MDTVAATADHSISRDDMAEDYRHSILTAVTKVIANPALRTPSAQQSPESVRGTDPLASPSLPDWFPQEIRDPSFPQQGLIDIIAALVELHKTTASVPGTIRSMTSSVGAAAVHDTPQSASSSTRGTPALPQSRPIHTRSAIVPMVPSEPAPSVSPRQTSLIGHHSSSLSVSPQSFAFRVPLSGTDPLHQLETDSVSCIEVQPPSPRLREDSGDDFDPTGNRDDSIVFFSSGSVLRPFQVQPGLTGVTQEAAPDFVVDGPDDNADLQVHHKANIAEDDEGNPDSVNGLTFYKRLGSGATSTVWLAVDDDAGEERAVKVIDRQHAVRIHTDGDEDRDGLLTEVAVMKKLRHPHIASMYDCIDDPAANHIYLVMQFVHGGAVASLLPDGGCPIREPKEVALYALQIGSALRYCHRHHVVHGDLKPDNILVERDKDGQHLHAYLTDFGASLFRGSANFQAQAVINQLAAGGDEDDMGNVSLSRAPRVVGGTPALLAPEVFRGHPRTPASDMWALGCTLFALLFGKLPFSGDSYNELRDSILNDEVEFPPEALRGVLRKFRPIIERLLEKRPKRRMTAWEVSHSPVLQQLAGISTQNLSEPTLDHSLAASWIEAIDTEDIKDALTPCRKFGMFATKLPPKKTTSVRAGA